MKTTKKLIALLLILAMGAVAMIPSTFSWYSHSGSQTGNKMSYVKNKLPVSAGSVSSVETKMFRMDGNKLYYDEKGNKQYAENSSEVNGTLATDTSGTVTSGQTQYFGTTFTNSGTAPVYVNLYLKDYSNNPKSYIGTIAPSLTHKGISSSVHLVNSNIVRVYFQWDRANKWNNASAKHYVVFTTKSGNGYICLEGTDSPNAAYSIYTGNQSFTSTQGRLTKSSNADVLAKQEFILSEDKITKTYYVDLPSNTTEFYFATDGNDSGITKLGANVTVKQNWYRTKTITNIHAETGYYLTGSTDDDNTGTAQYATFNIPGGISVNSYFDEVTMAPGQHAHISLNRNVHYTGEKALYSADDDDSKATINENSGYITALSGFSGCTFSTTITGSLGDTKILSTSAVNPVTLDSMPIATNVLVPGKTVDPTTNKQVDGKFEIIWYLQNDSGTCAFNGIYYTK